MKALGEGLERYAAGVYRGASFTRAAARTSRIPWRPTRSSVPRESGAVRPRRPTSVGDRRASRNRGGRESAGGVRPLPAAGEPVSARDHDRARPRKLRTARGAVGTLRGDRARRDDDKLVLDGRPARNRGRRRGVRGTGETRPHRVAVGDPLLVTTDIDVPVVAVGVHREGDWPRFAAGRAPTSIPAAAGARSRRRSRTGPNSGRWVPTRPQSRVRRSVATPTSRRRRGRSSTRTRRSPPNRSASRSCREATS